MAYKGRPCSACMVDPSGTGRLHKACRYLTARTAPASTACPMAYKGSGCKGP